MKVKQLLEQLNQLAKERPKALEMEVVMRYYDYNYEEWKESSFVRYQIDNLLKEIKLL